MRLPKSLFFVVYTVNLLMWIDSSPTTMSKSIGTLMLPMPVGWLIALTTFIGSGKTLLIQRLSEHLKNEGRVIVARSLSQGKIKLTAFLSDAALFCDL